MVEKTNGSVSVSELRVRVQEQGNLVRKLKESCASDVEIKSAIMELKARQKVLQEKELELMPPEKTIDRGKLENLLKQKFFYDQSFAIYGGVQGLYDYGPMGCAMKTNLLNAWRNHFVLEDHLLEVDCSMLTPHPVLEASGHVERFIDWMVTDVVNGECFRADHLIKAHLEAKKSDKKTSFEQKNEIDTILSQLDNYTGIELGALIKRFGIKSPVTNNDLSDPHEFNLMFSTMIGPTGQCRGYLRPETAQGIFVNFQRLLQFNQGRIPFGAAQIGPAFRNEISPRSGLIRVREFTMAEIEYFVDPSDKRCAKFDQVKNTEALLFSACDQLNGRPATVTTFGKAVEQGVIANETLGYFMARIYSFLLLIGVDPERLRFRQHLSNEMAHYACDCWDAECRTSYGWIECVGCADRSCFDLTQHAKATGSRLVAEKRLAEPRMERSVDLVPNMQIMGKAFRAKAKAIAQHLSELDAAAKEKVKQDLATNGKFSVTVDGEQFVLTDAMVKCKERETKVHVEEFVPNVIEPSFGVGRILYSVFEHSFRVREDDEQRSFLSIPPVLAPYKCSLLPLSNHPDFNPFIREISDSLTRTNVSHRLDDSSGSIGRRYARTDQLGIPFGITIDFDTVNVQPASVTLRERDSMRQIRVPVLELPGLVKDLCNGLLTWSDAETSYPLFEQQETDGAASRPVEPKIVPEFVYPLTIDDEEATKPNKSESKPAAQGKKSEAVAKPKAVKSQPDDDRHSPTKAEAEEAFPPLPMPDPNHGLFIGTGWPVDKAASQKKPNAAKPKPESVPVQSEKPHSPTNGRTLRDSVVVEKKSDPSSLSSSPVAACDWRRVIAQLEQGQDFESEAWQVLQQSPLHFPSHHITLADAPDQRHVNSEKVETLPQQPVKKSDSPAPPPPLKFEDLCSFAPPEAPKSTGEKSAVDVSKSESTKPDLVQTEADTLQSSHQTASLKSDTVAVEPGTSASEQEKPAATQQQNLQQRTNPKNKSGRRKHKNRPRK